MQSKRKIAIAIVPMECKDSVLESIILNGSTHVMSFEARGTAEVALLQTLGLGQTKKALIAFVQDEKKTCACDALIAVMDKTSEHTGILFTVHMETNVVKDKTNHLLVCVIVNAGYAEAVMQEAKKAGARGGTIINARGTGKEQDMDFFGIQIVPEKEMLVMVAERELAEKLVEVVKAHPLLTNPGSGLVFTLPAESCTRLGGSPA